MEGGGKSFLAGVVGMRYTHKHIYVQRVQIRMPLPIDLLNPSDFKERNPRETFSPSGLMSEPAQPAWKHEGSQAETV